MVAHLIPIFFSPVNDGVERASERTDPFPPVMRSGAFSPLTPRGAKGCRRSRPTSFLERDSMDTPFSLKLRESDIAPERGTMTERDLLSGLHLTGPALCLRQGVSEP